jgi:hypothetical protein
MVREVRIRIDWTGEVELGGRRSKQKHTVFLLEATRGKEKKIRKDNYD